jgi:hypothetical protein
VVVGEEVVVGEAEEVAGGVGGGGGGEGEPCTRESR